jgi:hypothetical protein
MRSSALSLYSALLLILPSNRTSGTQQFFEEFLRIRNDPVPSSMSSLRLQRSSCSFLSASTSQHFRASSIHIAPVRSERERSAWIYVLADGQPRIDEFEATLQLTWTQGRCLESGTARRRTSWVRGAVSPCPRNRNRKRFPIGFPSVHPK